MTEIPKNLGLDEIISIEDAGIIDTYDFTIPETHCFFANDILVHNSLEEDADAVIFVYRPEVYAKDEHEAAALKGKAVINLALNRHGPPWRDNQIRFRPETSYFHQETMV